MAKLNSRGGFTMIELIAVIVVMGILGVGASGYVVDLRSEARKAAAVNFITYLQSAINAKKTQMAMRCGTKTSEWPRLQAIILNDVTEGGRAEAECTVDQFPNAEDRKFLGNGNQPLDIPQNPFNGMATFNECPCSDPCDPACYSQSGFCYNRTTGMIWGQGLLNNCTERTIASPPVTPPPLTGPSTSSEP